VPPLIGLVLAGGQGARFGKPKGEVVFHGRTLAQCAAEVLWPLCTGVLVSIRAGARNPAPDLIPVEDPPPAGRGPLVGILAGMEATGDSDLLVLACDYPLIDTALLSHLAEAGPESDVVMLTDNNGRDHPLAAIWRRPSEDRVRAALNEKRYKVRGLLGEMDVVRIGPREFPDRDLTRALTNVNMEDQLRRMS
jgi:molybdopterin-guanine dinucleotide biosynthesis protein A